MKFVAILILLALIELCVGISTPCDLRETEHGSVCLCTDKYCDYLEERKPECPKCAWIVSSSESGLRFGTADAKFDARETLKIEKTNGFKFTNEFVVPDSIIVDANKDTLKSSRGPSFPWTSPYFIEANLVVNRGVKYQNITGFGGAFTGAVSYVLSQLSPGLQDHVYRSYYHKDGIGFDMMRMAIGGSDFDIEPWAYLDEFPGDVDLENFNDLNLLDLEKIEQIERLKEVAGINEIKIMATAWSAPRWMKSNNAWEGFSRLKKEYYQVWADYYLRWLRLMKKHNVKIWAISPGNEPINGVLGVFTKFIDMGWTAENLAIWLGDHLGPTIRNSEMKNTLIFSNEDQRFTYPLYFQRMKKAHPTCLDYLDGISVHWYWDFLFPPSMVERAREYLPGKPLINTESCLGSLIPLEKRGILLGSWTRGEKYIYSFIKNFNHNYNGWIDWNLILDMQGGPNYAKNFVDAAIIADIENRTEIYKQPIFYAMGHITKFVPAGSIRIDVKCTHPNIMSIAFQRPDQTIAVIAFNKGNSIITLSVKDSVRGELRFTVPPHSIHTIIYQ